MKHKGAELDEFDRKLIRLLTQDGRMSAGKAAQSLRVTPPTVRARLEALVRTGVLRIVALLDLSRASQFNTASSASRWRGTNGFDRKLEQISGCSRQVHWAAAVTGRFDLHRRNHSRKRHDRSLSVPERGPPARRGDPLERVLYGHEGEAKVDPVAEYDGKAKQKV